MTSNPYPFAPRCQKSNSIKLRKAKIKKNKKAAQQWRQRHEDEIRTNNQGMMYLYTSNESLRIILISDKKECFVWNISSVKISVKMPLEYRNFISKHSWFGVTFWNGLVSMFHFEALLMFHFEKLKFKVPHSFSDIHIHMYTKYAKCIWNYKRWCSGVFCIVLLCICTYECYNQFCNSGQDSIEANKANKHTCQISEHFKSNALHQRGSSELMRLCMVKMFPSIDKYLERWFGWFEGAEKWSVLRMPPVITVCKKKIR